MRTSMSVAVQFIVFLRIVGVPVGVAVRRSSGIEAIYCRARGHVSDRRKSRVYFVRVHLRITRQRTEYYPPVRAIVSQSRPIIDRMARWRTGPR
jgi:hypothetical protein